MVGHEPDGGQVGPLDRVSPPRPHTEHAAVVARRQAAARALGGVFVATIVTDTDLVRAGPCGGV